MDNFTVNKKQGVLRSSLLIKLFTILIFSFVSPQAFAQLDLIHYVPPLYVGTTSSYDIEDHWVVLTTPSETAIEVTIRRGDGTLFKKVANVSISTPQSVSLNEGAKGTIANPPLGVVNYSSLNKPITDQGLIFTSTEAFYVNIRHKSEIHGLSLTAKGQAALGTSFRSGHLYSVRGDDSLFGWGGPGWIWNGRKYVWDDENYGIVNHRSHFISVMATEDNTIVTFSDIKVANLTSDTKTALPVTGSITVSLNAGESYVLGADLKYLAVDEANSLNGTKIVSDKPIAVNSGSWCGGTSLNSWQDIGVDQIVPEESVGREYILLKGKGNDETERPIVVATQDNTDVFVNGGSVEITTLNAGDSYAIPSSHFIDDVMLIKTSEDVYLYQTTSASDKVSGGTEYAYATVGMNFIPPLSALGFRQVDIPFVTELGETGIVAIYAQKGSEVHVNDSDTPLGSPLAVTGNDEWVVYKYVVERAYEGEVVNVSVTSDKAIYVALSVEDNAVGAAGYFSGFTKSISPIDTTVVFNYDLGYVCSSQDGNLDLAINSKPIPDWYEWYHDIVHPDSIKFKNQNLNIPIPDEATKYILKAYFRDPNMDILYNGDFAIGWGSSVTSLESFDVSQLETPGKVTLTYNPKSINTHFQDFIDLDGVGKMLLAHSRGGHNDVIWEQTINSSTDIPDNLFVLKVYGRLAEAGTNQYLNIYVNDELVYEKFYLDDVTKWKSIKAYWRAGSSESANLKIVDANASGSDAVFAIDSISFVPAIEATKEFNPAVVPSYTYSPYDKGLHLCKGEAQGIADISYGDMGWFTFLWEKQELDGIYEPITDPNITGKDTYKLVFNNVVNGYAGTYRCTIGFRTDYEECGIGAEPTSVLVEVTVDDPATLEPLKGETKLCYGVSSEISTVVSGDFSLIRWTVYKDGETTPFATLENNSSSYDFNEDRNYATGKYKVRCEVVNGCSTDLYEDINIEIFGRPSLTSLDVPTNLCDSKPVDLTANGSVPSGAIMEYSWYRDNTLIETTNSNIYNIEPNLSDTKYKVGVAARYKIDGADDLVCTGNEKSKILVAGDIYPKLDFDLVDVTICEGLDFDYKSDLKVTGDDYTYLWETPASVDVDKTNASLSLKKITPGMAGEYKLTVTDRCETTFSDTGKLTITPKLNVTDITIDKKGPYCAGDVVTITIDALNADYYMAENTTVGQEQTINPISSPFVLTVNAANEGVWRISAVGNCGTIFSKLFTINILDAFSDPYIADTEACVGETKTLQAIVETPPVGVSLKYQWKDQLGNDIVGETSSTLEFKPVKLADAGEYTCVVSDGVCTNKEAKGSLGVDDITSTLKQGTVNVCEGTENYRFEISYEGNPTFAWYYKGADNVEQNLATTDSFYEIPIVTTDKAGLYYCVINSACGEELFEQTLNVLKQVTVTNDASVKLDICEGTQTELKINVTGTPNSIKWFDNSDVEVTDSRDQLRLSTGKLAYGTGTYTYRYELTGDCNNPTGSFVVHVHKKPSITVSDVTGCEGDIPLIMTVTGTDYTDPLWLNPDNSDLASGLTATIVDAKYLTSSGNYTAKISTDFCGEFSTTAKVNVLEPVSLVSNSELNPHVCLGKSLSLKVEGKGDALSYKWYKGATLLTSTENTLDITSAKISDEGNYRCRLVSTCGNIDVVFVVDVRENATVSLLNDVTVCEDDTFAEFSVTGTAEDSPSYQWYNSDNTELSNAGDFSGVTTSTLKIVNVLNHENKSFYCVVSGDYCTSAQSRSAKLSVGKNVDITHQPGSISIQEKGTASFSVDATGTPSASETELTYQWFVNTGSGFTSMGNTPTSAQLKTLILTDVPLSSDGYIYHCVVSGSCEPATSDPATLSVSVDNRITSTVSNAKACEGSSFTFTVGYNKTTDDCTWEYDDDNDGVYDAIGALGTVANSTTSSTLTVTTATTAMETDSWKFRARVLRSGYDDNVSNAATVTVYEQVVVADISNTILCPNLGGSFNVNTTAGTEPYTYEWTRVSSGDVLGSSSNLSLSVSEAVSEEYNVKVSNTVCPDVNKKFNITRYPDLVLTPLSPVGPLCIGDDINLSAVLTEGPASAATYVWTKDGSDLSEPSNSYSKLNVTTGEKGIYKVVVTDECTSKSSSVSIDVLDAISLAAVSLPSQDVCEGEPFDLQVKGTGDALVYNWYKIDALGGSIVGASLSNDKNYHVTGLSTTGANYYRCVLSTTYGCTPDELDFTVNVQEKLELDPLASVTICEDSGFSEFAVTTSKGTPSSYQWYDNDGEMSGETGSSISVNNVLTNNGHNYHVVVGGACNSIESNKALFTVNENVTIITQPVDVSVPDVSTDPVYFSVEATGTGLNYQWYKNTTSLGAYATADTKTLEVPFTDFVDGDTYYCKITGTCTIVDSDPATLTISITDKITSQPQNTQICEGSPFTFEVKFTNTVTDCTWEYDDGLGYKSISTRTDMSMDSFNSGDVSNVLTIGPSTFGMNGWSFRALVDGVEYSSVVKVTVYQKVIFDEIDDAILCIGTGASFNVNVTAGTTPLTYEWERTSSVDNKTFAANSNLNLDAASAIDGTYTVVVSNICNDVSDDIIITHHPDLVFPDLTHASPLCLGDKISLVATATSSAPDLTYAWTQDGKPIGSDPTYGKLPVEIGDRGIYKVIVKDKCTSKSSSVSIDVLDAISLARVSLESQNVCEGEPFDLQVQGTGDALVYNWYKLDGPSGTPGSSLSTDKDFHVAGLTTIGENYYRCVLSTTYGCTPDELDFTVNVLENVSVSDPSAITICEDGSTSTFSVTASGEAPDTYQWYNNAGEMSGENNSILAVNNVLANNGQNYYCIVGGACKSAESNKALFTVDENVAITSQPINQSINEMGSATFTVDATGTNLSYQWYENGSSMGSTPASAQTNTLSLSSVPFSSNGYKYKCVVSGTCVNATSTEVILTVIKENRILVQAENAVVCEGKPFTFVVQYKAVTEDCVWQYSTGGAFVDVPAIMGTGVETNIDANTAENVLTITTATADMDTDSWKFRALVKRTGFDDNVSNEVGVRVDIPASFDPIDDAQICNGSGASFSINGLSGSTPNTYTWTDATRDFGTNSSLSLTAAEATDGTYTVGVTAGVCLVTQTFDITHYPDLALADLIHDTEICPTDDINLSVVINSGPAESASYSWSKDDTDLGITTASYSTPDGADSESGLYKVTVEDECMIQSKSIRIDVLDVVAKTDTWTDKKLCVGDKLLLEATVTGDDPKYTWTVPTGVTDPGNVSSLKIDAVTEANEGLYECSVQETCGDPVVYSANVVVNDAPNITTDLVLNPICVDKTLQLGPIAYDLTTNTTIDESIVWKFNDVVIPGENGLSLDLGIAELDPSEKGNYRVEVSNACGDDYSIGYQDIYPIPTLEPIADQTPCEGENVVFNAVTTGEDLSYRWFVDDEVVAYTKEFIISDIQPEDEFNAKVYEVECIVSSSCSPDMSETATVTVNPTTILKSSLKGEVVYVGNEHVFDFNVTGSGLEFEWHHSKTDGTDETLTEATKTLTIESLSLEDAGEYYCKIKGDCGTRFTSGYLSVKDPLKVITSLSSDDIERCEGEPLNLNISVEGEVFDIQWYYAAIGEEKTSIVGQKELNYSIPALSTENAGTYSCVIIGEGLTVTEEVNVIVYPNTVLNSALEDKMLCEGEELSWNADVSGAGLTYTWKHEAVVIPTSTTSNILIEGVQQLDDAGLYTVDVEGKCGVVSTDANLTVKMLPLLVSNSDDLDLCENEPEAIFMATFTGDDLQYQWQKDSVDIVDANSTELKILDVRVEDAGDYTCIAISPTCGDATSGIMKLNVTPQLEILSETPGMDVCEKEDAQFEIEVDGNDVKYQWYKLGKEDDPIKGATGINTSQLSIDSVSLSEEGYYYCGVTDKCSTSERYSNPKKLTVNPLPNSKILGRMTLCVLEDRVAYNTEVTPYNNYGWLVDGGEFTMPAQGDRTKITWGEVVEGSKIGLEILNEETGCSFKLDSAVTLRPLPKVDLAPFRTYGICEDNIDLNKGIVNGEAEEGGIYWINGVAENEFIPSERGNGQYNVRYSYTDKYGCSDTSKEFVLTVDSLPIVKIMDDVVVGTCETKQLSATTDEDNILWSPNLYLKDVDTKTPTFTAGETTLYVAEVHDEHMCWGNDIINVTVAPLPTITTINDTIIGECKEIELTTVISGDIDEITWTNPGDLDEPDNSNPRLINRQVGVTDYQINVTDKYGCIASGSVKVEVLPNPEVGESQNLCEGESLVIDTRDLSNPVWTDGFSDWERTIDEPGEYMLSVEQNGCKLSQKIVMNPIQELNIWKQAMTQAPRVGLNQLSKDEIAKKIRENGLYIFKDNPVILKPYPDLDPYYAGYEYEWNDGSISSELEVSESGFYKLKVKDNLGCVSKDSVTIRVKPIGIESPDAFTPLSDNENDHFYLKKINVTDDFKMYVYDRWGELIYEASEPGYAGGWDGTYRGEDCPVGTYVWIVFLDGKEKEKGTVTLLR